MTAQPHQWSWQAPVAAVLATIAFAGCAPPTASTKALDPELVAPADAPLGTPEPDAQPGPLSRLLDQREADRQEIHDAIQRAIARCMAKHGFSYTPVAYPGTPGQNPGLAGLSKTEVERWTHALIGKHLPTEVLTGQSRVTDPTIGAAQGPDGAIYFRRNACTSIGRAAVYGDLVTWHTTELTVDHLAERVTDEAEGDHSHRAEIETRLVRKNRAVVDRFARLQAAAIARARALLATRLEHS